MKALENMVYHTDPRKNVTYHQTSRTEEEKILSSRTSCNPKLSDKPKAENPPTQCCGDLQHETKQIGVGLSVTPTEYHKKRQVDRKGTKDGELVKYMSRLPCYLQRVERGENLQEKALNFGVLDWERLEKWKHNQKQTPGGIVYPSSGINTSSPFSALRSSTLPSNTECGTSAHQRKQSLPLHANQMSSSKESHSQDTKPSRGNTNAFQDFKQVPLNSSVSQKKIPKIDQSLGTNNSEIKLDRGKKKYSDPEIISDIKTSSSYSKPDEVSFGSKGKTKARECESTNRKEQYDEFRLPEQLSAGKQKTIVLLLPRHSFEKNASQQFESKAICDGRPKATNHKSSSKSFRIDKEVQFAEIYSDIPHSCPLPCRFESREQSEMNSTNSLDARGAEVSVHLSHSLPCSAEMGTVPSRDRCAKENNSTTYPSNQLGRNAEAAAVRGRCPSPNHSAIGLGQMSRSFSSREVSSLPQLKSTFVSAKSGPVGSDASCLDKSSKEKANGRSKSSPSRSSPLRRLLDPLRKPKAVDRLQPIQDESKLTRKGCEVSNLQLDSSVDDPEMRSLNLSGSNPTSAGSSCQDEKHEAMTEQALLKVIVKDGFPSFTFAVGNNILTATMKKTSTSGKYDCSWIYTSYSFHKSKKKSGGWMNQGSKGKSQDHVPKVIGEMKVSSSKFPHNSNPEFMIREFILFGVEQKPAGEAAQDFQANNELAAVIIKAPKEPTGKISSDGGLSDEIRFSECLLDKRCSCNSGENLQSDPNIVNRILSTTTVVLPSGVHGMPATGVPSSLMDRWRSGGSCDCGGWDVGCNLRILANQEQCSKNSSLSVGFLSPVQFDLFVQGERAQERRPVFSLGTFKKGIFSVDFNASISSLQAFFICTAVLHSRELAELSETSNLLEEKISQELMSTKSYRTKVPKGGLEVPFPPPSPVERV